MNTAGNIQVKLGDKELQTVKTLNITQRINDHVRVRISGIVNPDDQDSYITYTESDTILSVNQILPTGTVSLFKGLVTKVTVESVAGIYWIQIEGVSFSYALDTELKTRSYQDQNMTYQDLLQEVLSAYQKADFNISPHLAKQQLNHFFFQYQESDWDFLKRIASGHNVGLVPARTIEGICFTFGIPDHGETLDLSGEEAYQLHKDFGAYRKTKANTIEGLDETDCWIYQLKTKKLLELGQPVKFQEKSLSVLESFMVIEGDLLNFYACLTTAEGLKQKLILNEKIMGTAQEGIVIDVQNDRVRVDFNVDRLQKRQLTKEKAFWFPYATLYTASGNTGWYWMPEIGDSIKVYFPSNREHEGVALDAVRRREKESERLRKPDIKFIRTESEKEFRFDNKQLAISTNEGKMRVRLDVQDGIEITSEKEINIDSNGDIVVNCGRNMKISADKAINLECKESSINFTNKGLLEFKGTEVKKDAGDL